MLVVILLVSFDNAKNVFLWCSWCHRIFPIQATCSLKEKELQTVVSKLVLQFMNDKQHETVRPVKVKFNLLSVQLLYSFIQQIIIRSQCETWLFFSLRLFKETSRQ